MKVIILDDNNKIYFACELENLTLDQFRNVDTEYDENGNVKNFVPKEAGIEIRGIIKKEPT